MKDQTRSKGEQVFFFGAAQTELAYLAAEESKPLTLSGQSQSSASAHSSQYYKSSTPLIAVIKYLEQKRGQAYADQVKPAAVKDPGFCVRSEPKFLFLIAKMCFENKCFIDLAV